LLRGSRRGAIQFLARLFLITTSLFLSSLPCDAGDFWPIWWEHGSDQNFLGPLISYDKSEPTTHFTVRPLLFDYDSAPDGFSSALWPLGGWSKDKAYFVPIYYSKRSEDAWDTSFLLLFWGEAKGKSYGGFFPFGGKLYERFGKEEIGFFLWPFYSHTKDAFGAERTEVLWPFFASFGGTEKGFGAWPLYGLRDRPGEKWRQFFLWPIFLRGQKDLDTDDPKNLFYIFPLYTGMTSDKTASHIFLWPFFRYIKTENLERYDAPWPLVKVVTGEEGKGFTLLPFYWRYDTGRDSLLYVMGPVYKRSERFDGEKRWYEQRWFLINRYLEEDRDRFLNVWPFFEYRKKDEHSTVYVPSVLPYRNESFDRILRPVITLYEYRRRGDLQLTSLLYGLYTKEKRGESWKRRFAFLLEVKREPEGYGFELLSGLFGVDPHKVKLFFIPIKRTPASDQPTATGDQSNQ
jgi:hypothetical protein